MCFYICACVQVRFVCVYNIIWPLIWPSKIYSFEHRARIYIYTTKRRQIITRRAREAGQREIIHAPTELPPRHATGLWGIMNFDLCFVSRFFFFFYLPHPCTHPRLSSRPHTTASDAHLNYIRAKSTFHPPPSLLLYMAWSFKLQNGFLNLFTREQKKL